VTLTLAGGIASAADADADAEPGCAAAVAVDGPPAIAAEVRGILAANGIEPAPGECGQTAVHAAVAHVPASAMLALRLADAYGRSTVYRVRDAADAASLIESWVAPPAVVATAKPRLLPSDLDGPGGRLPRQVHWIASVDLATGKDGSTWYGSSMTDCMELGVFCVGPRLWLARDDGLSGTSERYRIRRKAVDLMMVEAYPITYRRLLVMPAAGFGFGWMRSRVLASARESPAVASYLGFRADASTMFAVRLTGRWSLAGEVGVSYVPASATLSQVGSFGAAPGPSSLSVRAGVGFQFTL